MLFAQPLPDTYARKVEAGRNRKNMAAGNRRGGKPRTNAERKARHKRIYGTTKLPPRGTGRKRNK